MAEIEFSKPQETAFTKPIKRAALRDKRLTWGARGLFQFIWDLPGGWRCNMAHLIRMAPDGRSRLVGLTKELQAVGAISIIPRHLTSAEAEEKTVEAAAAGLERKYRAGQIVGWRWKINHPDAWAVETSLSGDARTPENSDQESPQPKTEKPSNGGADSGKTAFKVSQEKGSPISSKERRRAGRPPSSLVVDEESGINFLPNNARDKAAMEEIRKFPSDKVKQAAARSREGDDLARAFPSAVLRFLRKEAANQSENGAPAWTLWQDDSLAVPVDEESIDGECEKMEEENEESF